MSFFLLVTIVLMIAMTALVILRRRKKNASRSGRYRSPMGGGGLTLERPGSRRRKAMRSFSLQPRHILLSLVLLGMVSWLASGYFLSEGEPSNMVYERKADAAALPEQYASLGGQIFTGSGASNSGTVGGSLSAPSAVQTQAGGGASNMPASAGRPAQESALRLAAHSALPANSKLDQVGLKLTSNSGKKAAANNKPSATVAAASSAKAKPQQNQAAVKAASLSEPAAAAKKAERPTSVAAASPAKATAAAVPAATAQPQAKPQLATNKQPAQKGLLSASRQYTVHLGSFGEKGNAENYLAQLVAAGEKAFISESSVDGRLWHRVMSGRFDSRDDAESYGRNLKRRGLTIETGRYLVKSID